MGQLHRRADVELPPTIDGELEAAAKPHLVLGERIAHAVVALEAARNEFDVLLIYLPERWERSFEASATRIPASTTSSDP